MAKTKDYKYELDTPCLTIDIEILEKNIAIMQAAADAAGKSLRPHAKTHKCSQLAKKQIEAGAIGVCGSAGNSYYRTGGNRPKDRAFGSHPKKGFDDHGGCRSSRQRPPAR